MVDFLRQVQPIEDLVAVEARDNGQGPWISY